MKRDYIPWIDKGTPDLSLLIVPPYKDETTSSVIERAAAFHRTKFSILYRILVREGRLLSDKYQDVDRYIYAETSNALCRALGLPEGDSGVWPKRVSTEALKPSARRAYCPICFSEDLRLGRTPHFRWQWAHAFVTLCHVHETPLFNWRKITEGRWRVLPSSWVTNPVIENIDEYSWVSEDLESAERAKSYSNNPNSALGIVKEFQRQYAILERGPDVCVRNRAFIGWNGLQHLFSEGVAWRESGKKVPLASELRPQGDDAEYFSDFPESTLRCSHRNAFRNFYALRDVGWRRSIIFFIACNCERELVPGAPITEIGHWEANARVTAEYLDRAHEAAFGSREFIASLNRKRLAEKNENQLELFG